MLRVAFGKEYLKDLLNVLEIQNSKVLNSESYIEQFPVSDYSISKLKVRILVTFVMQLMTFHTSSYTAKHSNFWRYWINWWGNLNGVNIKYDPSFKEGILYCCVMYAKYYIYIQ